MKEFYQPPFTMTEEITGLVIEIGELVGAVKVYETLCANPMLRRANRIKTIYSSLAIEQNTLTLEQVSDIIEGKRVLGPQGISDSRSAGRILPGTERCKYCRGVHGFCYIYVKDYQKCVAGDC